MLILPALAALQQSTGIIGTIEGDVITLRHAGHVAQHTILMRSLLRRVHVPWVVEQAQRTTPPAMLVTRHVSAPLAELLRQRGVSFLDMAGNVHLRTGAWLVLVTGRTLPAPARRTSGLSTSAWQVAYVLLRDPSASTLTVRELGARAGVSHGTASTALHALADRGWLRHLGRQGHPIQDAEALLGAWELGYLDRLASRLHITRARPMKSLQAWGRDAHLIPALLGGGLAAEHMGLDLIASTAVLHVAAWNTLVMKQLHLIPDPHGPVTILRTFGTDNPAPGTPHLADPLLIRAALLGVSDERLRPARAALRNHILTRTSAM